jgi:3-methyladenine DNA glycosylase AlkD
MRGDAGVQSFCSEAQALAAQIESEIRALLVDNTPRQRLVRRKYSRLLRDASGEFVVDLARELIHRNDRWMVSCELVRHHQEAFKQVDAEVIQDLGRGIRSWGTVDCLTRTLAGPAWLRGQISDERVQQWARSESRWWRRAALVSTVAWNVRSKGGPGDVPRTLAVCRLLVDAHDDTVVKALSWALRELVVHNPQAVRDFLRQHDDVLAARVKREVTNKLQTGLKNPRRS